MSVKVFPYKGRTIQSGPDATGKGTLYGYEASTTEADRIKTTYGEQYVSTATGKPVVFIGGYQDNDKNKAVYFPTSNDKAILQGISNYDLANSIQGDPNFYRQATGKQSSNTTPVDPNQPGTPGTSTPGTPNETQPNNQRQVQRLTYPSDMKPDQDKIKFQAVEIQPRTQAGQGLEFNFGSPTYKPVGGGPVVLAIQSPISDQNSVDWGPDSVNAIDAALYKKSLDFMQSGTAEELGGKINTFAGQVMSEVKSKGGIFQRFLAGQAASINNVLARTDNVILNPNLELLFQGPQLRPFSFTFKLSPRNKKEATEVRKIIRYFKENMAVRAEDGLFLKAPYVFTIQYFKGSSPHKSINTISPGIDKKACALTNCSVDYTPLGTYMTYNDEAGTMVSYTLSLQFQELTPIYNTDYKDIPEDAIGY